MADFSDLFKDIKKKRTPKEYQIQDILNKKILKQCSKKKDRHKAIEKLVSLVSIGKPLAGSRVAYVIFDYALQNDPTCFSNKTYRYLVNWISKSDIYIDKAIYPYHISFGDFYSYDTTYAKYISDNDVESILSKSIKRIKTKGFSNCDSSFSYANAKRLHFFLFLLMDRKGVPYAMDFFTKHKSIEYIQEWFNSVITNAPYNTVGLFFRPVIDYSNGDMASSFCVSYKKENCDSVTMYAHKNPNRDLEESMNYSLNIGHSLSIPFHRNLSLGQLVELFEWADKHLTFKKRKDIGYVSVHSNYVSMEKFKKKYNNLLSNKKKIEQEQKQKKKPSDNIDGLVTYQTSYNVNIDGGFVRFTGTKKSSTIATINSIISEIEQAMNIKRFNNERENGLSPSYEWLTNIENDILRKFEEDLTEDREKEFCYEYNFKGDGKKITLIITNKELEKVIE